jgi:transcriptional regulator with XRE-family HTH domain
MNLNKEFGIVLKRVRNSRALTQKELAIRSGCHPTYISRLEGGKNAVTLEVAVRLTRGLNIPFHEFVGLVEEELTKHQPSTTK